LVEIIEGLEEAGIGFVSISDGIDTTTASGKLVCRIISAIADFERSLIAERTRAGMEAARRRGKQLGRPRSIQPEQLAQARRLLKANQTVPDIARLLTVNRTTLRRALGSSTAYAKGQP
jgi:DNA invertase Pin-like site-specific DNA recombinase